MVLKSCCGYYLHKGFIISVYMDILAATFCIHFIHILICRLDEVTSVIESKHNSAKQFLIILQ